MANVIKHKRGSGSDPVASDLVVGEVAIRTDVGKLFTKMDNGSVAEIAGGGSDIAINTLSSSSGTGGGSATFNGSAYRFTLSSPPSVSAQQLLVSINGVVQKPVAGTGQPSEGFSVDGTDIILGDAPASGSDFFILTFKSLGVSEPADNSVTSAKIVDGAIVNADVNASAAIAGSKIDPTFSSHIEIQNASPKITFTDTDNNPDHRIQNSNGTLNFHDVTNGVTRLQITIDGNIQIPNDSGKLEIGASQDLKIYHDGSNSYLQDSGTGHLIITTSHLQVKNSGNSELIAKFIEDGAVELNYDHQKKFETTSSGATVTGTLLSDGLKLNDNEYLTLGTGNDFLIGHAETSSFLRNDTGELYIRSDGIRIVNQGNDETYIKCIDDGAVELYHDNSKKFETHSGGVNLLGSGTDAIQMTGDVWFNNNEHAGADIYFNSGEKHLIYEDGVRAKFGGGGDLEIIHDGTNSRITNITNDLRIESDRIELNNQASNEFYLTCTANGAVELYYNNSNKFETNTEGVRVNGYLEMLDDQRIQMGTTDDLQIYHEAGFHSYIRETQNGNLVLWTNPSGTYSTIVLGAGQENSIICNKLGSVELYHISGVGSTSKKFETTSVGAKISGDGEALRIQGVDGDTFMKILGNTNINVILGHLNDQGFVGNSTNHDFFIRTNNQNRISISNSGTLSGDLNDTSDENLKENIVSISDGAISDIKKLRPVNFDWKDSEKAKNQSGFIAQEVKTIFPNLVVGEEYDESKENFGFAINTSGLVAHLTKALQEAIVKIETLETKVTALEAA